MEYHKGQFYDPNFSLCIYMTFIQEQIYLIQTNNTSKY